MTSKKNIPSHSLQFFVPNENDDLEIPLIQSGISAGFPSPAEDFKETRISLDKTLVKNKDATFYARVSGKSMINAGLDDGDLLVIDRSIEPQHNKIAVCFIDGEFTVKRLKIEKDKLYLVPENNAYKAIKVTPENNLMIWGIVTYVIKAV